MFSSGTSLFDTIINQFHLPFVVTTYPENRVNLHSSSVSSQWLFFSTFLIKSLAYLVSQTSELLTCPGEILLIFSKV